MRSNREMLRIQIKDAIREELKALHGETGIGPQRLLNGKPDRPPRLSSSTIYQWMDGTLETAKSEHLEWVLSEWRSVEALEPFTAQDLEHLQNEMTRTGYGPQSLLRRLSPVPKGLVPETLHRLRSKRLKKIAVSHKTFLFDGLKKLPNR